jgi:hypothetical protein
MVFKPLVASAGLPARKEIAGRNLIETRLRRALYKRAAGEFVSDKKTALAG